MIYKQSIAWQCGQYACLNALQRLGVEITEQEILSYPAILWFPAMNRILRHYQNIGISRVISPRLVSNYLKQWKPLVCLIYSNNFESVRNPPHIQDFKGHFNHFVCLVEDCGDLLKYVDQQGANFWDKGHWYIRKEDLKNTRIYKIND